MENFAYIYTYYELMILHHQVTAWVDCSLVFLCCLVLWAPSLCHSLIKDTFGQGQKLYWLFSKRTEFQRKITHVLQTQNGRKLSRI